MKDAFLKASSLIAVFAAGCLLGGYALLMHLRLNSIEQQHLEFVKNVEEFSKQVNAEFQKIKQSIPQAK